jgi:hypothetical protein
VRVVDIETAMEQTGLMQGGEALSLLEHLRREAVLDYGTQLDAYSLSVEGEQFMRGHDRWGNFPVDRARWELRTKGQILARVNVSGRPEVGSVLLFAGRFWSVVRMDRGKLHVNSAHPVPEPLRASYDDVAPLVPGRLANKMGDVLWGRVPQGSVTLDSESSVGESGLSA